MHLKYNQKGVTLLELTVATAIFATLVLLTGGIYKDVIESQRSAIAAQDIQETMRYAMEFMSKEIRHAQGKSAGSACPAVSAVKHYTTYNIDGPNIDLGNALYFQNASGTCVKYWLNADGAINRLQIDRGATSLPVTPDEINVKNLVFYVEDYDSSALPGQKIQPKVTMVMTLEMASGQIKHKQTMRIQTTISARSYRQ